jgi:MEMO1 family protein
MKMFINYILACLVIVLPCCSKSNDSHQELPIIIHNAHLPSGWYTQEAQQLDREIEGYLNIAHEFFPVTIDPSHVKALIVPHAGHYYSGLCAATAYQSLLSENKTLSFNQSKNTTISRVIVLCPTHTIFYTGIALPDYTVYRTALGDIPLDAAALKKLSKFTMYNTYSDAHAKEHAIEIQLPFLQKTIADFTLVPLVVGHMSPESIALAADALRRIIDDKTLIVISTDFTHHGPNYDYDLFDKNILDHVRLLDSFATQSLAIQSLGSFDNFLRQTKATICGQEAIKILLTLLEAKILGPVQSYLGSYYTSAQLAQARAHGFDAKKLFATVPDQEAKNSVSYVSMIYAQASLTQSIKQEDVFTGYEKQALLKMIRNVLENSFKEEKDKVADRLLYPIISQNLMTSAGAFVTLNTKDGQLRGCIGRILSQSPLYKTVADMAYAAAFNDTRFKPLTKDELDNIVIDISILTPPIKVTNPQEIVIGKHGVILNKRDAAGNIIASSVFLPQVPRDWHWNLETTLEQLSLKAGLGRNDWKTNCDFEVFEGFEIKE